MCVCDSEGGRERTGEVNQDTTVHALLTPHHTQAHAQHGDLGTLPQCFHLNKLTWNGDVERMTTGIEAIEDHAKLTSILGYILKLVNLP